jgi:hypothetical protein
MRDEKGPWRCKRAIPKRGQRRGMKMLVGARKKRSAAEETMLTVVLLRHKPRRFVAPLSLERAIAYMVGDGSAVIRVGSAL